jgi:hypothetical protein
MTKKIEVNNNVELITKKRGRKAKKDMESTQNLANNLILDNINVVIEETQDIEINNINSNELISFEDNENVVSENINFLSKDIVQTDDNKPLAKKRGRKPKGGKIIQQSVSINNNKETKPNVILHLKCSIKDLQINSMSNNDIQAYNFNNQFSYDIINGDANIFNQNFQNENKISVQQKINEDEIDYDDDNKSNKENDIRELWRKLKVLEHNLHINNICDKKSACFWCTYEFDNPPVYIPKYYIKDLYHVYGCFCSPECATAYLMEECIDSSSKFERYHLINHIYSKIYDYKKILNLLLILIICLKSIMVIYQFKNTVLY